MYYKGVLRPAVFSVEDVDFFNSCNRNYSRRTFFIWSVFFSQQFHNLHYSDGIMSAMASQIISVPIVYVHVCSGAYQIKHQNSASLSFVMELHRWPMNSPHKRPLTQKCFHLKTSSGYNIKYQNMYGFISNKRTFYGEALRTPWTQVTVERNSCFWKIASRYLFKMWNGYVEDSLKGNVLRPLSEYITLAALHLPTKRRHFEA